MRPDTRPLLTTSAGEPIVRVTSLTSALNVINALGPGDYKLQGEDYTTARSDSIMLKRP